MKNDFVKNILDRLFGKDEPMEQLNGPLVRSASFEKSFAEWKAHADFVETYTNIYHLFCLVVIDHQLEPAFQVFSSPQARGFYFNNRIGFEFDIYPYVLDSFKERVIELGYSLYTSDRRYNEVPMGIQQIDRHFLKPVINPTDAIRDQKFGNVLLELHFLDEIPQFLKVLTTVHTGKRYTEPLNFISFGEELLALV